MRALMVVIGLTLLLSTAAFADDGSIGTVGGALVPLNDHPSVRMVREDVSIKIMNVYGPDGILHEGGIKVDCRFVFRNEGAPCTVKMGFPEDYNDAEDITGFRYFRSKVDGKRVYVRKVLPATGKNVKYRNRGWRVKNVHFNRNQTRIVEDTYGGGMGGNTAHNLGLTYILTTGRSWHGPIGEAVITVDISTMKHYQTIIPRPSGFRRHGNIIAWRFRNVEPQDEIGVTFWPGYSKFIVNGKDSGIRYIMFEDEEHFPFLEQGMVVGSPELIGYLLHEKVESLYHMPKNSRSATFTIGSSTVRLSAGNRRAVVDGRSITLPRAPYIRTSKSEPGRYALVAPIAPILRALGATVTFDRRSGATYITTAH